MLTRNEIALTFFSVFALFSCANAEDSCSASRGINANPTYASCGAKDDRGPTNHEVRCSFDPYGPPKLEQLAKCKVELCNEYKCSIKKCDNPGKPKCTSDNETIRKCQLQIDEESCNIIWHGDLGDTFQLGTINANVKCGCLCKPLVRKSLPSDQEEQSDANSVESFY